MSSTLNQSHAAIASARWSFAIENTIHQDGGDPEHDTLTQPHRQSTGQPTAKTSTILVCDFIEQRFVPEYLEAMSLGTREHLQTMLKHVLSPDLVNRMLPKDRKKSRSKLTSIVGWPYLDPHRMCDIEAHHIQQIISAALNHGYSIQTVAHIRNVIRKIFEHAQRERCFHAENPALRVVLPRMTHTPGHVLSVDQLQVVIRNMRYPERDIALLGVFTDMSVAEIFGLQWKYINMSETQRLTGNEWIPAQTIAVRNQSYRSQVRQVTATRKRDLPITDLTYRILQAIKTREKIADREGFVFASRNGTPLNQDNIAVRRLKLIGKRIDIPWLSWSVFHRTRRRLNSESRKRLEGELIFRLSGSSIRLKGRSPSYPIG
jgi:site-specific recombinase XerC